MVHSHHGTTTSRFYIRYRGLFDQTITSSYRPYCVLFSFFFGVIEMTLGSVFYHVSSLHPTSGGQPIHTPPVLLALGLIGSGIVTTCGAVWVAYRYAKEQLEEMVEDDLSYLQKDDLYSFDGLPV